MRGVHGRACVHAFVCVHACVCICTGVCGACVREEALHLHQGLLPSRVLSEEPRPSPPFPTPASSGHYVSRDSRAAVVATWWTMCTRR